MKTEDRGLKAETENRSSSTSFGGDKDVIKKRKRHIAIAALIFLLTLAATAGMLAVFSDYDVWIRVTLGFSAVVLGGFSILSYVLLKRANPTGKFLKIIFAVETAVRIRIINRFSMIYDFVYAGVKLAMGIFTSSYFLAVSALYSLCMGMAKRCYFSGVKKSGGDISKDYSYYIKIAAYIFFGSAVYILYMSRMFFAPSNFNVGKVLSILIATVSFSELGFSIYGYLKCKDVLSSALKSVSLTSSLFAIVLTQVALTAISGEELSFWNGIAGVVFGGLSIAVSILMMIKYLAYKISVKNK